MNNEPLSFDVVVWDLCFEVLYLRYGLPQWVAARRVTSIPRSFRDDLSRQLCEAPAGQRSRTGGLAIVEEVLVRRLPDLLQPSEEEWA